MNGIISKAALEARRQLFKPDCRVELVSMNDPYAGLKPADRGRVEFIDDIGTAHIRWDNGSTLGAAYGEDVIKPVPSKMSDAVRDQIMSIRTTGETNMFDTNTVQRLAFDRGYYELVDFIETDHKAYTVFILTGEAS